jgi:hypothetical protein
MENTPNKESSAIFQGILIAVVVIALFFSGNLLGKLGADPAADKEEDTQVEDVIASTSESTTVPTTAPTTQPTTQATPDVSEDANQTTAPSNDVAPSGEMSKAEIIALFNESANRVKTEATKVVKNYEYKRMLEEHLDVPSALNGMMDTLMGSVMKDDLEPQEYTGEMIIEKYPVPRESWSSQLTEADVIEATCVDNGTEYEITLKLVESFNPSVGKGVAAAMDTITEEDKAGIPDMVQKMDMRYFDCVIRCKIDKASGRTTWSNYLTPVVFDCEVKMIGTLPAKVGFSFEKDYTITY